MPDYDFSTLSPIDFENLCRDLIQKEFNVLLESFAPGKDKGIDFRGFILGKKTPFLYKLVPLYADLMKDAYPELEEKQEDIASVILAEEERF